MEHTQITELAAQVGDEQKNIWSLVRDADKIDIGLNPYRDGWSLKAGNAVLYFSGHPVSGLAGLAQIGADDTQIWVDSAYSWNLTYAASDDPAPVQSKRWTGLEKTAIDWTSRDDGGWDIRITGQAGAAGVRVCYRLAPDGQWLDEDISILNTGERPIRLLDWDFGPARKLTTGNWPALMPDLGLFRAAAVPWRRLMSDPDLIQDYDLQTLITGKSGWVNSGLIPPDAKWPSDAWALLNGGQGLLVMKFAPDHLEYSVLRHETRECMPEQPVGYEQVREERREHLLFGGSARCHQDPTPGLLQPGEQFSLGLTRYCFFAGDWQEAFSLFRDTMDSWGCGLPANYDTYLHWNELYDNQTIWYAHGEALKASKAEHYRIEDLKEEAAKAAAFSCETLYLDPGWDTIFASSIWDEQRLGAFPDFTALIKKEFNLRVALHTPLAAWCDAAGYPESAYRVDRTGQRHQTVCGGSRQYLTVKAERLRKLAAGGASFLMFDGSFYTGSCYDPSHGHPIPYTRDDHIRACRWLARQVHEVNPDLKIEIHDLPTILPYDPVYLAYGNGGWDELWGWEMMWDPLKAIRSGQALSLYYYNLAYAIPIYLHIDLRKDNSQTLMLWWYASTCRHLGIGGTHEDPAVVHLQQQAMRLYRKYKEFFVRGRFIGLDETAHLHVLPDLPGGVLNLFNLTESEKTVSVVIPCRDLQIKPDSRLLPAGIAAVQTGEAVRITASLQALSPLIICLAESSAGLEIRVIGDQAGCAETETN